MPARTMAHDSTYQLRIAIKGIRPPIWRCVRVPGRTTLRELHQVIQTLFGWTGGHLHQFEIGPNRYGEPDELPELENLDERPVTLAEAVGKRAKRFLYVYDFGDDWRHEVLVEKVEPAGAGEDRPVCAAGKRHRPPEDCGGPWGYANFLKAIKDPNHKQHQEMLEWIGGRFDSEEFQLDRVNKILAAAMGRERRVLPR